MRFLRHLAWPFVAAAAIAGCGSRTGLLVPPPDASILSVSGKVDLLFMIDNSGSMGDKQELLREAIPDFDQPPHLAEMHRRRGQHSR